MKSKHDPNLENARKSKQVHSQKQLRCKKCDGLMVFTSFHTWRKKKDYKLIICINSKCDYYDWVSVK